MKIDVLPAPFGPMIANNSSGSTSNDTLSIAVTPPNLSVMSLTASSDVLAGPSAAPEAALAV